MPCAIKKTHFPPDPFSPCLEIIVIYWFSFKVFPTEILYHFFLYRHILLCHLERFIITALKYLSYHLNIWVISGLTSVDYFPLGNGSCFLCFFSHNFELYPGLHECYVAEAPDSIVFLQRALRVLCQQVILWVSYTLPAVSPTVLAAHFSPSVSCTRSFRA